MYPAARLQFERMIGEYGRWRAVPENERSLAPAWWWGPAMELRNAPQSLPVEWCAKLGLPEQATYAAGAEIFLKDHGTDLGVRSSFDIDSLLDTILEQV